MSKKVVIIGGVAGGAGCAARLRRLDEHANIVMFERGEYVSFANCGLPYHIGGVIKNREDLILQTPKTFYNQYRVEVRIRSEVTCIDRARKTVCVTDHINNRTYEEPYDVLVISTGSSPIVPPIPGIRNERVKTLWTIPNMDSIASFMRERSVKDVLVIGGGFIGLETAENIREQGISVTVVEMNDQVMPPLDMDMANIVHHTLQKHGIRVILSDAVASLTHNPDDTIVTLSSGQTVRADLIILSAGVRPNGQLAKDASLTMNAQGGIVTDRHMRTSDPSIYAVGDVAQTVHLVYGSDCMIPLAGPAGKTARVAADHICGLDSMYHGTQGSSVVKLFDLTVANTGLCEKQLKAQGLRLHQDYEITVIHPPSHADYYPKAQPLTLKMIFDRKGLILGAQAAGTSGVEKRIDVIATAMRFRAHVRDLHNIELCYSPPYSSAKDPVNMAGYTADNILANRMIPITPDEWDVLDEPGVLVDVRTEQEVKEGSIEGAVHIPIDRLREACTAWDRNLTYVLYCAYGTRSYMGCRILMQNGFANVKNLLGGYQYYKISKGLTL